MRGARLVELDEIEQQARDHLVMPRWCLVKDVERDEFCVVSETLD